MSSSLFLRDIANPPNDCSLSYIGLNQDHSFIVACSGSKLKIFNTVPYKQSVDRDFKGDLRMTEMLFRCNVMALVGGAPAFNENSVVIWDDNQKENIAVLNFKTDVKCVKLKKEYVVVVLERCTYVYNFDKLKRVKKFDTCVNTKGIVALSACTESILAIPHTVHGEITVANIELDKKVTFKAHEGKLSCISLSPDGKMVATASEKGTLIRVFNTENGKLIKEVRRGTRSAEIYSISFSKDLKFICTTSSSQTIHIFSLEVSNSWMNYISSDKSFAWYKGVTHPSICCFNETSDAVILFNCKEEYKCLKFDTKNGGEAELSA